MAMARSPGARSKPGTATSPPTRSPGSSSPAPARRVRPRRVEHLIDQHSDGAYAVLRFTGECPRGDRCAGCQLQLSVRPRPAAPGARPGPIGRSHPDERLQPRARAPGTSAPAARTWGSSWLPTCARASGTSGSGSTTSCSCCASCCRRHGATTALRNRAQRGAPVWIEVVQVVTAFTVAHSITLQPGGARHPRAFRRASSNRRSPPRSCSRRSTTSARWSPGDCG